MREIKEKKRASKLTGVLLIIAGIIIFTLLDIQNDTPKKVDNSAAVTNNGNEEENSADSTEENDGSFTIGDSVELNDITVTFNGVTESTGTDFNEPNDGNIFVLADFIIENNSEKEITMSTMLSFDAYQDGYVTSLSWDALAVKENAEQLDGSIAPGKKMKGVVGYEIPSSYSELEIQVKISVWSSKKITFVYTK